MTVETGLLGAILGLLILSFVVRGDGGATARLSMINRKLDLVLSNLGIDPLQGLDKQVAQLVRSGQKIEAIKLYRAQTGVGLKEAKDYVEGL